MMKKTEIMDRMKELQRLVEMPREELITEMNTKLHGGYKLDAESIYPFMVGWISSEIKYIVNGGKIG